MKKALILTIALGIIGASFVGCNSASDSSSESTTETEAVTMLDDGKSEIIDPEFKTLFPFITTNGTALNTEAENEAAIAHSGQFTVKTPTVEEIESSKSEDTLFKFVMINTTSPKCVDGLYVQSLTTDDMSYSVVFGDDETSALEDVTAYAKSGTTMTYYAFARKTDSGTYMLIPVIAGNDDGTGYYFVRPALAMLGYGTGGLASPPDTSETDSQTV